MHARRSRHEPFKAILLLNKLSGPLFLPHVVLSHTAFRDSLQKERDFYGKEKRKLTRGNVFSCRRLHCEIMFGKMCLEVILEEILRTDKILVSMTEGLKRSFIHSFNVVLVRHEGKLSDRRAPKPSDSLLHRQKRRGSRARLSLAV